MVVTDGQEELLTSGGKFVPDQRIGDLLRSNEREAGVGQGPPEATDPEDRTYRKL